MNNSIYFILLLLAGISCSEPEKQSDLSEIYESLSEQKHFYYNLNYTINNSSKQLSTSLYGMVALNRNSDSGISSGYFGMNQKQFPNYLHSMYLNNEWIHDLSSNIFDLYDADVLTDSLHSPILINPDLLFDIKANSNSIAQHKINNEHIKWIFNLEEKHDQLILVWSENLKKITELEYKYDVNSPNSYSRKWSFDYLSKTEFNELAMEYKYQNQITHQPFL
ncbi:hypothetical protein QYS49_37235 [Marivirga salinae]|uniref:Lipoprotein n=1 Tax=Marivirga salinarum TaxID=3059078 RepID=A0AA51NCJ7_9BACT|nr:hypothetical protein [Marivirga sp. BDSF4-3]WMN11110.1 hypothetical protein QYS49_37235 [Marivirga sp. BDSF4-3]